MASGACCGVAPFLFCNKPFGFEGKEFLEANKTSVALKGTKTLMMHNSCGVAGNFITMTELRKKLLTFRDLLDLPPCVDSASVIELVVGMQKDLRKLYPDIIPSISISETEASMNQALMPFCDALKYLGNLWMSKNELMVKRKNANLAETDLEQLALAMLDEMILVAKERSIDMMDEDDQMRDYSPPSNYLDKQSPFLGSPVTPTSVLPEMIIGSAKETKICYSPPLLLPLRVQAVGKLNPIDLKLLSFHMFPHVSVQDSSPLIQIKKTHVRTNPDIEANHNSQVTEASTIWVDKDCEMAEDIPKSPMTMDVLLPPPSLPKLRSNSSAVQALPPPPAPPQSMLTPTAEVSLQPGPPASSLPILLPTSLLGQAPPPTMKSRTRPPPPPPPPTVSRNVKASPPPPPPPPSPLTSRNIGTTPLPPPRPMTSRNMTTPPLPPPPPMMSSNGSVPSPPPPMPLGKGAAPPPPPAFGGGRSLRAKATNKLKRSSQMGNLYRLLKGKVEGSSLDGKSPHGKKGKVGASADGKKGMADALAEMTKRSAYFQQIEEDVKNHSQSIREMKIAISSFQTSDMAELFEFHKQVESLLEKLTDETQVLARFEDFPTKKLEALRMAAALHTKLDTMVTTLQNRKIVSPVNQLIEKVENYFTKIKGEMETLERTKDEESKKFQSHKINFDFSILVRIKELMVDVSSSCMELALKERRDANAKESGSKTDGGKKGSAKMLWKAFQFAFRVYTFAGGHDDRADKLTRELAQEIETDPHQ